MERDHGSLAVVSLEWTEVRPLIHQALGGVEDLDALVGRAVRLCLAAGAEVTGA